MREHRTSHASAFMAAVGALLVVLTLTPAAGFADATPAVVTTIETGPTDTGSPSALSSSPVDDDDDDDGDLGWGVIVAAVGLLGVIAVAGWWMVRRSDDEDGWYRRARGGPADRAMDDGPGSDAL